MWKWLSRMFSTHPQHGQTSGELPPARGYDFKVVPDQDYEFKIGTQPALPDGLRDLKITEIRQGLLLLENFDADLTVDQSTLDRTTEKIAMAVRSLRWAKCYHQLEAQLEPPVRLHQGNVLLSATRYFETKGPEGDISLWLDRMGWNIDQPFVVQTATSSKPLEHGFFSCVRIGKTSQAPSPDLAWKAYGCQSFSPATVLALLADFVREEMAQPWWTECERFLEEHYSDAPPEQRAHPVFALLDFPGFDMGMVRTTFAGSIWSAEELRFWSRPTYFHK